MGEPASRSPEPTTTATATSHFRFPRAQRLARASEIELVKRTGKRVKTGLLDVRVTASPSLRSSVDAGLPARVGVIVPKYGRMIVERNRLRRRLRELVRIRLLPSLVGRDVLIRALPQAYSASFDVLAREIDGIVARIT